MTSQQSTTHKRQFGQSLVETALLLPILIVIIAGVVEISQLVITQNRVSNAARVGARFAANGGQDEGMHIAALNSVTQTLEMDENNWDMWSIRATVNDVGDGYEDWSFVHTFGVSNTVLFPGVNEVAIQQEVLAELQTDNNAAGNQADIAAGVRVVGSYILHDVESIIGLDAVPAQAEFSSVRALNVMRKTGLDLDVTAGCSAFPIAVNEETRSATKTASELLPGEESPNPYPEANHFTYPGGPPHEPDPPTYSEFIAHSPNIPLLDADEGDIFKIRQGAPGTGSFGWLVWNTLYVTGNANELRQSIDWPGNSTNYPTHGYYEPGDPTDTELNIGDWVASSTGTVSSVSNEMTEHVLQGAKGRTLRLIVYNTTNGLTGSNRWYQVSHFAIFKFHGYNSSSNAGGPWIIAEFVRFDDSCGQAAP